MKVYLYSFFNLGARWGRWSTPLPGRFPPPSERDPVPIIQDADWAPGPVWTVAVNFVSTEIRSPDGPACSESSVLTVYFIMEGKCIKIIHFIVSCVSNQILSEVNEHWHEKSLRMHLDKVWSEGDTHFNYGTTSEHIYNDKVP